MSRPSKRSAEVKRAADAVARAEREFLTVRFMVGESMDRLETLLSRPRYSLKAIHHAAAEAHSDTGGLYGIASALAELRQWERRARDGKRRGFARFAWPDAGAVVRQSSPRRRRIAEDTLRFHEEQGAKDRATLAEMRRAKKSKEVQPSNEMRAAAAKTPATKRDARLALELQRARVEAARAAHMLMIAASPGGAASLGALSAAVEDVRRTAGRLHEAVAALRLTGGDRK